MNLLLEKGERVTTRGKSRGEIGGEAGEISVVVANALAMDDLGERYRTFSGWGMAFLSQPPDGIFVLCSHTFALF